MGQTDLLRSSRDGDQFHYHWAARQALRLLRPGTDLAAVVIEGVSPDDTLSSSGDEVVDLAEYRGTTHLRTASKVVYRQLKHSTEGPEEERTSSYLKKTLAGFAKKYRSVVDEEPDAADRVWFEFVSVPPLAASVKVALEDVATGREPLEPRAAKYILEQLAGSLTPDQSRAFMQRFVVRDGEPGLLRLRHEFRAEVASFLPGAAAAQDILLRDMVSTRASSIAGFDPVITRATVLSTLQATEEMLLPAANLIEVPTPVIELPQVAEVARLVTQTAAPVIAHTTAGMGKSVLAATIGASLPDGSVALVYDCFGNGGYRRLSSRRHEHRQVFLELSNELAAKGLCEPVLPSNTASAADYMQIFLDRVATAAETVTAASPDAVLLLAIDAADNAVMAAEDAGTPSFVPDLIREELPPGTRLLLLCRTERKARLGLTPACVEVHLRGFDEGDSATHLKSRFAEVSDADALEFHHLTHGNPRVQALVMNSASSVEETLKSLGEVSGENNDLFADLMSHRLAKIRDDLGGDIDQVDNLCRALAALRPRIPVEALATIAGVDPGFIRSFATELGQSILLDQDTVQFRDEPTETWFRSEFRPRGHALAELIETVGPLAEVYPYLSASLPQLLYEADMVRELVELALSDDGLAAASDLERREIAHQRAQFALKAALRDGREVDAARLAWAAGELHAGETRRLDLIRANTDLAGEFLDPETIDSLLANRSLAGSWPGSHLHVEGALLAATGTDAHLARSRLRSAQEWMAQWTRQAHARDESHDVTDNDIAEIALGILNVDGPGKCVEFLARWTPPWVAFQAGRIVARRLVDHNNKDLLEELAVAAGRLERLQLAVVSVAAEAGMVLSDAAVRRAIRMLKKHRAPLDLGAERGTRTALLPVAWTLSLGIRHGLIAPTAAHDVLAIYLPDSLGHDAGSQFDEGSATEGLLFAFTLDASLRGVELVVRSVAPPSVKQDRGRAAWQRTRALADFDDNVVPLARWMNLYVDSITHDAPDGVELLSRYDALAATYLKNYGDYETPRMLINGIARTGVRLFSRLSATAEHRASFAAWLFDNFRHLTWRTVINLVRVCSGTPDLHQLSLELATRLRAAVSTEDLPAEERYDTLLSLARATYAFDSEESRTDFDRALEITNLLGEDVHDRWRALERIARDAALAVDQPAEAYRLAQVAEGLQSYLGGDSQIAVAACEPIEMFSSTTAVAIASRWRDRRVAHTEDLVGALTSCDRGIGTHPLWALGMIPIGASARDRSGHLSTLSQAGDPARANAEAVIDEWERPFRSSAPSTSEYELTQVTRGGSPEDSAEESFEAIPAANSPWATTGGSDATSPTNTATEAALFANFDLTTPSGWDEAVRLANADEQTWVRTNLLLGHAAELPPGKLRPMLEAAAGSSLLTLRDFGWLIDRLGSREGSLPEAARKAVGALIDRLVPRFARQLTTGGYDPLDYDVVEAVAGRSKAAVVTDALRNLGTVPELLTSGECFALVSRLTGRAAAVDNAAILDDALESFSQVAPLDVADGPFEQLRVPPADLAACTAAFVWCAAGDPAKATRWRAAHTIRLWASLGCTELIDALLRYASGEADVAPFVDSRLVFYERHALMSTLMAMARACDDDLAVSHLASLAEPFRSTPLVPLLRRILFTDPPNAVLHHSARIVLLRLHEVGAIALEQVEVDQLSALNKPTIAVEQSYRSRPESMTARLDVPESEPAVPDGAERRHPREWSKADTQFSFFMDFEDHWCDRLGRAFGVAARRVLELVDEVIVDRWGSPFRGRVDEDRRQELRLYGEGGTYTHKSSWPAEDDLDFYLSLHALYEVAGHLARHRSAFHSEGAKQDDFAEWLGDHTPTRRDGRWVFDRRDPIPYDLRRRESSTRSNSHSMRRRDWLFDISAARFNQILRPADGWLIVNGYWTETQWDRHETVDVDSVLVDSTTAHALVAALQTAPNLHVSHLPRESDHGYKPQRRERCYRLVDLVENGHRGEGIDMQDPNASDVQWPPPTPTDLVVAALELSPDRDLRNWENAAGRQIATSVWSTGSEPGSTGRRLQMTESGLSRLLAREQRDLVVSVRIRRYLDSRYGSGDQDDVTESLQPYIKYFLLRSDGTRIELAV